MERLLRRSLTMILKRIFEIRKEKKVNINQFTLNILFRIMVNDLLSNLSVIINKFINIYFFYLQGPNDFKVTIIMKILLRRSLTTILKRIFEIRKEKKVNIYEFTLNILFKIVVNDLLINLSVIMVKI